MDVVRERLLAVDLDDGQQLPVARLQRRVAGDVDLLEGELDLAPELGERRPRAVAEVAALGVIEADERGYG